MSDNTWTLILSNLFTLVSAGLLPWFKENWFRHRNMKARARYFAIRLVCTLDLYVSDCAEIVGDDGIEEPGGCYRARIQTPSHPVFPDIADDWLSIDHKLMYDLLSLPAMAAESNRYIDYVGEMDLPPDYGATFEERQYQYARLGLFAADLAQRLRKFYDIPKKEVCSMDTSWDTIGWLREQIKKIEQKRLQRSQVPAIFATVPVESP